MKIILILVYYSSFVQFINSRKYRLNANDELYPYIPESNVPSFSEIVSIDNFILEQIDDDKVMVGGYMTWMRSMDRNSPVQVSLRTQYLHQGKWNEGPFKLIVPDICPELTNPSRYWYNLTKLVTLNVCPPQKGDKWMIEQQEVMMIFDLPPSVLAAPWRSYYLVTQGIPGFETYKFGFGVYFEVQLL